MPKLEAIIRTIFGKQASKLREEGLIPAEVYGHGAENMHISVNRKEFNKVFKEAGENKIVELTIEGKKYPVLVHDISYDQLGDGIDNIDFYIVKLDEKVRSEIPLVFVGEAPAVKELGGVLVRALDEIEVEALPAELPSEIEVDISVLKEIDQALHVGDLKIPAKATLKSDPETVVAIVNAPRVEEEAPAAAPAAEEAPAAEASKE